MVINGQEEIFTKKIAAQDLNKFIEETLKYLKLPLSEIDFFGVLTGEGSFTGSRMGITTSNTLAHLLKKPIFELNTDSLENVHHLALTQLQPVSQVIPRY